MVTAGGLVSRGRAWLLGVGALRGLGSSKQASWLGFCCPSQGAPTGPPGPRGSLGWTALVHCPRSLDFTSLAVALPQTRPLPLPPLPPCSTTWDHPLLTLPLGKARPGARMPQSQPARGAQGDPGVSCSPLGLHLQPASVMPQLAESEASILWLAVLSWPTICPCHILVRPPEPCAPREPTAPVQPLRPP